MNASVPLLPSARTGLRVLVLEDNDLERLALAAMLRRLGVSFVEEAANGQEALMLMEDDAHAFDLVLCDLQMRDYGKVDGIEFLRLAGHRLSCPLVLVSGIDETLAIAAETLAGNSGARWGGRLRKPVQAAELHALLSACTAYPCQGSRQITHSASERQWSKADVRMALNRGELVAYFQPQYCLASGLLSGAEALARWRHPQAGLLGADQFVPLMEREGMIDELFDVMLEQSLDLIESWAARGERLPVSVNASALTLENVNVPDMWRARVEQRGLDPGQLTIEVTETAVARNFHGLLESVIRLRMHGFRVSLDDFGTSFSTLQQMSELPATEVKIDRSFLDRAMRYERARLIFESIVRLGCNLGLAVVAEGVETQEQADFARAAGCNAAQGWFYGKPVPAEELLPNRPFMARLNSPL